MASKIKDHRETNAVDEVLVSASDAADVIVVCVLDDGAIEVRSSIPYPPDILWALTIAQQQLFELNSELDS